MSLGVFPRKSTIFPSGAQRWPGFQSGDCVSPPGFRHADSGVHDTASNSPDLGDSPAVEAEAEAEAAWWSGRQTSSHGLKDEAL